MKPAGTESWHNRAHVAASGKKTYMWTQYSERIHPPQQLPDDDIAESDGHLPPDLNPAYICHMRANIKYSPWKLANIAAMVRGMQVDEAITQLGFVRLKGGRPIREAIEEAVEIAVKDHNVEFRTDLWVAESFAMKSSFVKGVRRHARGRLSTIKYYYANYFLRLEEGKAPENYYVVGENMKPEQWLEYHVRKHREKTVPGL